MNNKRKEDSLTLEILEAIEERSDITQRHLARRTGVALGLANSYLKRCVRKGLVKIQQAPANRYMYYLTLKGLAEKSRLTAEYLSYSFEFYRRAGESCADAFGRCRGEGWSRVALCGASDLAEIAALRAMEAGIAIAGVYDPVSERERLLDHRVRRDVNDLDGIDAWLVTDLEDPRAAYERLVAEVPVDRVLVPSILGVQTRATG